MGFLWTPEDPEHQELEMLRFSCLRIDPFFAGEWRTGISPTQELEMKNGGFDVQKLGTTLPSLAQVLKQTHQVPVTSLDFHTE